MLEMVKMSYSDIFKMIQDEEGFHGKPVIISIQEIASLPKYQSKYDDLMKAIKRGETVDTDNVEADDCYFFFQNLILDKE